ncbi:hypothetical protein [Fontivita pretiosa]|uniref:hypothetical protein n=1 Tax=Fontivita pretiosa TaxID=2989684 RepID=UPI003D167FBE
MPAIPVSSRMSRVINDLGLMVLAALLLVLLTPADTANGPRSDEALLQPLPPSPGLAALMALTSLGPKARPDSIALAILLWDAPSLREASPWTALWPYGPYGPGAAAPQEDQPVAWQVNRELALVGQQINPRDLAPQATSWRIRPWTWHRSLAATVARRDLPVAAIRGIPVTGTQHLWAWK